MNANRWVPAIALTAIATMCLVSCGAPSEKVTISRTDPRVTLNVGDVLEVDFGEVNSSVGDAWIIVTPPDSSVLSVGESHEKYLGKGGMVGAPSELSYTFKATGQGATTIEFEYRFRGAVPDDVDVQESASIEITVN